MAALWAILKDGRTVAEKAFELAAAMVDDLADELVDDLDVLLVDPMEVL